MSITDKSPAEFIDSHHEEQIAFPAGLAKVPKGKWVFNVVMFLMNVSKVIQQFVSVPPSHGYRRVNHRKERWDKICDPVIEGIV